MNREEYRKHLKEVGKELDIVAAGLEEFSNGEIEAEFIKKAYKNEPDYLKPKCLRAMKEELEALKKGEVELTPDEE